MAVEASHGGIDMQIGGRQRMARRVVLAVLVSALLVAVVPTPAPAGGLDDPGGPGIIGSGQATGSTPDPESTSLTTTVAAPRLTWSLRLLFLATFGIGWLR